MFPGDLAFPAAVVTTNFQGDRPGDNHRPLRNGAFCQDVQVHLDALRHNTGKRAHTQFNCFDAGSPLFQGGFDGNIQNTLGNGQFVHGFSPLTEIFFIVTPNFKKSHRAAKRARGNTVGSLCLFGKHKISISVNF